MSEEKKLTFVPACSVGLVIMANKVIGKGKHPPKHRRSSLAWTDGVSTRVVRPADLPLVT